MRPLTLLTVGCLAVAASAQDEPQKVQHAMYNVKDLIAPGSGITMSLLGELIQSNSGARDLAFTGHIIVVRATEEDHSSIQKALDRMRKGNDTIVKASVRIVTSRLDLRSDKSDALIARLNAEDIAKLEKRLEGDKEHSVMSPPHISLFDRQPGNIVVCDQIPYISQWKVVVGADGKGKSEPVRTTANVGCTVTLVPTVKDKSLLLESLAIELTDRRPGSGELRKIETPHGIVEDPEIRTVCYELKSPIGDKETLLVGPLRKPWGGDDSPKVWLLISGEILKAPK